MAVIIEKYLTIFFIYSFLGWAMETINGYIKTKKLVNRGFLIGPYCPVYGIGVSLLTVWLTDYVDDLPIMFCMSILICGTLEYFTSYIMEKIFKARWWDYSNRRFNINGRICLETLVPFGILGIVLVRYANPFFLQILNFAGLKWILIVLCIIFVIDFIFSFKGILGFRKETKQVENEVKDNTEEISKKMMKLANKKYSEFKENAKEDLEDMSRKINLTYKKLRRNVRYTSKKLYNDLLESAEKFKNNLLKSRKEKETNILVKERVKKTSWITRRLLDAFPDLEIRLADRKEKNKKDDNK